MPLSAQKIAVICESAMIGYAKSPRLAQGEVRVVIVEDLVEEAILCMDSSLGMNRARAVLTMKMGWMLAESYFYIATSRGKTEATTAGSLGFGELAPHILELLDALVVCVSYLHKHWNEFSASPACSGLTRAELAGQIRALTEEVRALRTFYDQKSHLVVPRARFLEMNNKGIFFLRVVFGEQRAKRLFGNINGALSQAYSYVAASYDARHRKKYVH